MARIKEPFTHDYVFYGIITALLAACVVGLHYYYGEIAGFENKLSQAISDSRNSPWIAVIGLSAVAALSYLFLHRRKRRRKANRRSETSARARDSLP